MSDGDNRERNDRGNSGGSENDNSIHEGDDDDDNEVFFTSK